MDNSKFPDLQVTQYFDPSDKNYFNTDVKGLTADTLYGFNFQWVFEDEDLNTKYNTLWSNTFRVQTIPLPLAESTDVVATWGEDSLQITWKSPTHSTGFQIALTGNVLGVPTTVYFGHKKDLTTINQKIVITKQQIMANFGNVFQTTLSGLLKTDYINAASNGVPFSVPAYVDPLSGLAILDSSWLITPVDKGFSVSWNSIPTTGTYWETVVYKSSTQNGTYLPVGSATNAPVIIEEINAVYIKIRHRLITGEYSAYSNYKIGAAYVPIIFDETPPNEVTVNSATWSGNDLLINYTMPATDPGTRFKVTLTTGIYTGYFYDYFPATSGTFTFKITNDLISKQLSSNQSTSYDGKFISIDAGDNPTSGAIFSTGTLTNPGAGETPAFILTGITNGYTATWNTPSWATYTRVWEGTTSGFTPNDSTNLVYSGSGPAIIKTLGTASPYSRRYIRIRNFGPVSGQQSEFYSAEQHVDPVDALTADILAPNAPSIPSVGSANTGVDASGTMGFNGFINLNWNAVSDPTLRGYRIRFRPYKASAPFENYSYVNSPGTGTSYRIAGLALGATYEVAIASYDEYNNTSSSYTSYSNQQVSGTPAMSNFITAGAAGFQFGSGIKDKTGTANASAQGLYLSNSNYWYLTASNTAQFKIGGPSNNYIEWNGDILKIDGDLGVAGGTTIGGNISMKNSGASIYAGTLSAGGALTTDGFLLNSNGLSIKKGTVNLRLDTTDGGIYADYGKIANWSIDSAKIEKLTGTTYAGMSSTGTFAFYAGGVSTGTNAPFRVTHLGAVNATNISIVGTGDTVNKLIDAGDNFHVRQDGFLKAIGADITGKISAGSGTFTGPVDVGTAATPTGQLRVASTGGTILIGHGLTIDGVTAAGITATNTDGTKNFWVRATDGYLFSQSGKIGGWSIGTSKLSGGADASGVGLQIDSTAGGYAFWAGSATPSINTAFSVTNTGILRATNAIISGTIKATDGFIGSDTTGWTFNSTSITSRTPSGKTPIVLDGLNATISGGTISGTTISGGSIIGTTVTSNATSGKGKVQLDGTNSRILFNSDQTGFSFSLDSDTSTVTSYSYSSATDTGADAGDGNTYYNTYYNTWTPVPKTVAYNEAISLKRTDSNDATLNNPKLTLSIGNASYESFLRISNQGSGPTAAAFSSITLQKGGVIINTNRGALKIENMIDTSVSPAYGAHYAYASANNFRLYGSYLPGPSREVGVPLVIKSDGSVSTGRAIFKTSASEATITSTSGSANPYMYMGLDGDIMFSTSS